MTTLAWPIIAIAVLSLSATPVRAQISVTAPAAGANAVNPARDWATREFQNPMDMSERTDLGWWQYAVDQPRADMSGITAAGGVVSGVSTSTTPRFFLLETSLPTNAAVLEGRTGGVHPIDATLYRVVALRVRVPQTSWGTFEYWGGNIYSSPQSLSGPFRTYGPLADSGVPGSDGWHIYVVDVPSLGVQAVAPGGVWGVAAPAVRVLHFDPTDVVGASVALDWVRIVNNDPGLYRTIGWTGSTSAVDVLLDSDTNYGNGTWGTIARSVTGSSLSFYVGALPPGDYYVAVRPSGSSATPSYSPGFYRVARIPTVGFLSPSPEGSSDDFATTQLGDPWDMTALSDIDSYAHIDSLAVRQVTVETEAGTALGAVTMLSGTGRDADPYAYLLSAGRRGAQKRIDTDRYRILTAEIGVSGRSRDLVAGSVGRFVWRRSDEAYANVSEDIVLRHLPDRNVVQKLSFDMKQLPLESDPGGSPARSGWTGQLVDFRVDSHEFSDPTGLFLKRVKLAAFERTGAAYTVRWNYGDTSPSPGSLALFYDLDDNPDNGHAGVIGQNIDPRSGSYVWTPAGLPQGSRYYVCAEYTNGAAANATCSRWPVIVDSSFVGTSTPGDVRLPPGDYDGDGRADVAVFRPSTGTWYLLRSRDGGAAVAWGAGGDVPVPGDYDGDRKTDVAVFRPSTGVWYLLRSRDGGAAVSWGTAGDVPMPGDYDGDRRTDVAVFRPSAGTWYLLRSRDGGFAAGWGVAGDTPTAADYDGDGRTDVAVYRPSTGTWYLLRSRDGGLATTWGAAADVPVPGDYDGDGRADVAVFRPSAGAWYLLRSRDGGTAAWWGASGDVPTAGDYDGDGRVDLTVFRPSSATWYQILSASATSQWVAWGGAGDLPL